jgi:ubiquinol-cytochrome c reductase iron-sulfur subunit
MAPLTSTARACVRAASQASSVPMRALSTSTALCAASSSSSYSSPFNGHSKGTQIPDFSKYKVGSNEESKKLFSYFTVGALGAVSAAGAKSTVQGGWARVGEDDVRGWARMLDDGGRGIDERRAGWRMGL